jgi:hypothetical protein
MLFSSLALGSDAAVPGADLPPNRRGAYERGWLATPGPTADGYDRVPVPERGGSVSHLRE